MLVGCGGGALQKSTPPSVRGASIPGPSTPSDGSRPIPLRCLRENIHKTKSNRATTDRSEISRFRHTPPGGHFHPEEKYASRIATVPRLRPRATFAGQSRKGTPRENHLRNNDEISAATRSSENSGGTTPARASSSFRRTSRSAIPPVHSPRDIHCR